MAERRKKKGSPERKQPAGKMGSPSSQSPAKKRTPRKNPVFRFVLTLALLMGVFNFLFYVYISDAPFFEKYLEWNARAAGAILSAFGADLKINGQAITAGPFSLGIKRGCDAIQASAFFVFLLIASPSRKSLVSRLPFIVGGTLFLLLMNLVRILSLYYAGVHGSKAFFDFMHVDFWQAIFIFMPLFLWIVWVRRTDPRPKEAHATKK